MDDATQKLVDEAREYSEKHSLFQTFTGVAPNPVAALVGRLADALEAAQRPPVSPEVESLEQELFKHQPVLSMRDGSIAGCQCSDRVFHKRTEDWGTHLAEVFVALSVSSQPVYDEEAVERVAKALHENPTDWQMASGDWGAAGHEIQEQFRAQARVALATLRGGELTREEKNRG